MPDLPSGTVTFLFTDVEGSTRLLHELGAEGYASALAEHRRLIRDACAAHGGVEVDTQGDAFFFAFPTGPGALAAAAAMTEALASGPIQVRVGLHTGTPLVTDEGYVGDDVHLAARVAGSAHGGQVVLTRETAGLVNFAVADLGEHRLKDIEGPVAIFQLGDGSFPPLKTISNTNLPRPASSFVGRERELEEVLSRIERGARLVSLTGPGGSGKTRLAIEAAATLVPEYKAGVFWVGLAALRDPALVTETIAQTLGAKDGLAEHIGERELLLLLDNLEQVIEAAPELSAVLEACPNLNLLVTSRELLRVRGEVEYPVPPLAAPEAVSLFCERAQVEPSDEIHELCVRLDNLPLAVELAAARTKALSPAQILERLAQRLDLLKGGRDADPRQQTLRATIEWSYDLLSPEEQELFAGLSVFAGGCTLESAEEIAGAGLDTLQSLVEKSLLRYTDERFWMLETIREYAAERLDESGEAEGATRRHADWFLALAEQRPPREVIELHHAKVEREHDNFRAALATFRRRPDPFAELRLAAKLGRFWLRGGFLREGLARLEEALRAGPDAPTMIRASGHERASSLALQQGDLDRAEYHALALLALAQSEDWSEEVAAGSRALGAVAAARGQLVEARKLYEEALAVARAGEHQWLAAFAVVALGDLALYEGDFDRAAQLAQEGIEQFRAIDVHAPNIVQGFINLSLARLSQGRPEAASGAIGEAVALLPPTQLPQASALVLEAGGAIAEARGNPVVAAKLLAAATAIREEIGFELPPFEAGLHRGAVERLSSELGDDLGAYWSEGAALTTGEAVVLLRESLD